MRRPKILMLVNPFGGKGKAMKIYKEEVGPMLSHTHLDVEMMPTQRAGHATEIGQTLELGKYDAVVTASGDGLLHELMNGLMAHERWQEAIKTAIGVIPCGSGNGLAACVGSWSLCLILL